MGFFVFINLATLSFFVMSSSAELSATCIIFFIAPPEFGTNLLQIETALIQMETGLPKFVADWEKNDAKPGQARRTFPKKNKVARHFK